MIKVFKQPDLVDMFCTLDGAYWFIEQNNYKIYTSYLADDYTLIIEVVEK